MSRSRIFLALLALAASSALAFPPASAKESEKEAPAPAGADEEKKIDFEPIPWDTKDTKTPKAADWVSATRVRVERRGPRAENCRVWRAKNWVKVHCDVQTTAASLVGGDHKGVSLWMPEPKEGVPAPGAGEVMFPIRPGDRRIFELFSFGETYGGSMVSPGLVLQEYWIEGEAAPVIVLY